MNITHLLENLAQIGSHFHQTTARFQEFYAAVHGILFKHEVTVPTFHVTSIDDSAFEIRFLDRHYLVELSYSSDFPNGRIEVHRRQHSQRTIDFESKSICTLSIDHLGNINKSLLPAEGAELLLQTIAREVGALPKGSGEY